MSIRRCVYLFVYLCVHLSYLHICLSITLPVHLSGFLVLTLKRDARSDGHRSPVSRARVRRRARKVSPPVTAGSQHGVLSAESVDAAILCVTKKTHRMASSWPSPSALLTFRGWNFLSREADDERGIVNEARGAAQVRNLKKNRICATLTNTGMRLLAGRVAVGETREAIKHD